MPVFLAFVRGLLEKRPWRIALWVLAAVLTWAALLGLAAPPLLRGLLENQLRLALGNATSLESLRINPFTLGLRLTGITVPLPDGQPCFTADVLELRVSPRTIPNLAPTLTDLRLTNPSLTMVLRKDGRLSVLDFLRPSAETTPAESAASDKLFALVLTDMELVNGRILFQDQLFQTEHEITELNLLAPLASTREQDRELPIAPRLSGLVDGRPLSADANLTPFAARGRNVVSARLAELPVARLNPYLKNALPLHLTGGALSLDLGLGQDISANGTPEMVVNAAIQLRDVDLRTPEQAELLRLDQARVGLNWDILGKGGLVVSKAEITGLSLSLARKADGGLELLDWLPKDAEEKKGAAHPLPVLLQELSLRQGRIAWQDNSLPGPFTAEAKDISLDLTGLRLNGDGQGALRLSLNLEGGGSLSCNGSVDLSPQSASLDLQAKDVALKPFSGLLPAPQSPAVEAGTLGAQARLVLTPDKDGLAWSLEDGTLALAGLDLRLPQARNTVLRLDALQAKGVQAKTEEQHVESLSLAGLSFTVRGAPLLQWRDLTCSSIVLEPGRQSYAAGSLILTQPVLSLVRFKNGQLNVLRVADRVQGKPVPRRGEQAQPEAEPEARPEPAAQPTAEAAAAGPETALRLGLLELKRGRVLFRDANGMQARVDNIAAQARGLDTRGTEPAPVELEALVNGSPLKSSGRVLLASQGLDLELVSSLNALELTPLSPLAERFLGYSIAQGRLTLDSTVRLKERNLDTNQRIQLLNFDLGDKTPSPEAIDAPVQLGLSLLKDSDNNIDVNLPVRGSLDSPDFDTGSIVRLAVSNLIVAVITSPFAIIGKLFSGSDAANLEYIGFDPGDGRLADRNTAALKQVAELMGSRPSLTLGLIPQADDNDRESLGEVYIHRRMQEMKFDGLSRKEQAATRVEDMSWRPGGEEALELLFEVYKEEPFPKPRNLLGFTKELSWDAMYDAIDASRPKDQAALEALAAQRAESVRAALLALNPKLEPRIRMKPPVIPGVGPRVLLGSGE